MALTTIHNAITSDATSAGTVVSGIVNIIVTGVAESSATKVLVLLEDVEIGQIDSEGVKSVVLGNGGTLKIAVKNLAASLETVTVKIVDQS